MGCVSSKVLGDESDELAVSKGISMAAHQHSLPEDFHIVALTSSTYGILKLDPPKASEDEKAKDTVGAQSVKEVLSKLENGVEVAPQSWQEVSDMLQNLKPGLERESPLHGNHGKFGVNLRKAPDSIDVKQIMAGLDDDAGLLGAKVKLQAPAPVPLKRSTKPFEKAKSVPIRTLEELEACLKEKVRENATVCEPKEQEHVHGLPVPVGGQRDSALFDAALLGSYQNVLNNLSKDDLKALDTLGEAEYREPEAFKREEVVSSPETGLTMSETALLSQKTEAKGLGYARCSPMAEVRSNGQTVSSPASIKKVCAQGQAPCSPVTELRSNGQIVYSPIEKDGAQGNRIKQNHGQHLQNLKVEDKLNMRKASVPEVTGPVINQAACVPTAVAAAKIKLKAQLPLDQFEELCPPGGENSVVLYITSLRGIRKTYEDCNNIRSILQGLDIPFDERDVSMHLEYRNELRELMERVVSVPRLFIKGRYVGGAEEVLRLHEAEKLAELFDGVPAARSLGMACDGCAGARFVPCFECSGSRKVVNAEKEVFRCPDCNENGLMKCPICS